MILRNLYAINQLLIGLRRRTVSGKKRQKLVRFYIKCNPYISVPEIVALNVEPGNSTWPGQYPVKNYLTRPWRIHGFWFIQFVSPADVWLCQQLSNWINRRLEPMDPLTQLAFLRKHYQELSRLFFYEVQKGTGLEGLQRIRKTIHALAAELAELEDFLESKNGYTARN